MNATGDQRDQFLQLWEDLLPEERMWTFQTLVALQREACVAHCAGCILAANGQFAEFAGVGNAAGVIGQCMEQLVLRPMLHITRARLYDENDHPYTLVGRMNHTLALYDVEPHPLHFAGQLVRLLFLRPLAKIQRLEWLQQSGAAD